jgi:hypothetical protein
VPLIVALADGIIGLSVHRSLSVASPDGEKVHIRSMNR